MSGRSVAIAEGRELDVLAGLLERRGAVVLRYPLIRIVDAPDPAPILAWARRLAERGFDDLVLLTGEGLRRILACLQRHEPALREAFVTGLANTRKLTRGPKPARALRELGLTAELTATEPTSAGVLQTLRTLALSGHRVGVQLYGDEPNEPLVRFLQEAGATVHTVAPYRYAPAASDAAIQEMLERMSVGAVDAIAFTSKAQIQRLFDAAPHDQVQRALASTRVAAVGPVVAAELARRGVRVQAMPADAWFMKPLTAVLVEALRSGDA